MAAGMVTRIGAVTAVTVLRHACDKENVLNDDHMPAPTSDPVPPAQSAAAGRLAMLRAKLNRLQAELAILNKKRKGFFVSREIEDIQDEMKKIALEISELEKPTRGGV
jgi:hypothetical protein